MEIILKAKKWGLHYAACSDSNYCSGDNDICKYYDSCSHFDYCGGDNGPCKDEDCWGDGQVTDDCMIGA